MCVCPDIEAMKHLRVNDEQYNDLIERLILKVDEDGYQFDSLLCLARGGMVLMEVGDGQAADIVKLFPHAEYTMITKDLAGKDRFVRAIF